jgi:chromosome segregation ATPase
MLANARQMLLGGLLWLAACGGTGALGVSASVLDSLPRDSRIELRDAVQEVVIAREDVEDAQDAVKARDTALDTLRRQAGRAPAREKSLREADVAVARIRLDVAHAELDVAERRLTLADARRQYTRAAVLRRHELISSESAKLPERETQVKSAQRSVDDAVGKSRRLLGELDKASVRRDQLLDRHLQETAQRPGAPWID